MTARTLVALSILLSAACEARLTLGARCAYSTECPPGLVCALGRCRDECLSYRDCDVGSTCLLDEATGARACRVAAESACASAVDCGGNLVCEAGRCAQPCVETAECQGLVCVDGPAEERVCVEPSGAACAAGADCGWGVCTEGRCDSVRALAAGAANTCVLLESGEIECAGSNVSFELALDDSTELVPAFRPLRDAFGVAPPFESVAIGQSHLCALGGGEVRCWGAGAFGQTAGPSTRTPPFPDPIVALDGVREISLGYDVSCARTATQVICWGTDRFGILGDAAEYPSTPATDPSRSRPAPIDLAVPVRDIDAGYYHACAVTLDGDVWCWGPNDHTNLGAPDTGERCSSAVLPGTSIACSRTPVRVPIVGAAVGIVVDRVTVGVGHTCVLTQAGAVHCWGANHSGQIGDGTPVGADVTSARFVLDGATDVQAGADHTCALMQDGRVACWGRDGDSELGDGGGGARTTPVYVSGLEGVVTIAIGERHGCALVEEGSVWCWGADYTGQLGDGSTEPRGARPPTPVPALVRTAR